jgi:Ca2+-transporting ATPase
MGAKEWIISLALGFIALPLGALIRLISNEPCKRVFVKLRLLPKPEEEPTFPSDVESSFASAVDRIADNIGTFAKLCGDCIAQFIVCSQEPFDCP